MNIDERIKQELAKERQTFDSQLPEEQGLFALIAGPLKSRLRFWYIIVNIITFIVTIIMFWTGYQFFVMEQESGLVFWGICFLLAVNCQIALKQWIWMEMNRRSILREIKRVELSIQELAVRVKVS
ncbi:DUF6768 family protein [Aliikangiella maris]|uniref:DUF6768 family protein n=2 Tax=Aliikangiella maris TaxID=3162458 RepID=A0ABV3MUS0_9GAMM